MANEVATVARQDARTMTDRELMESIHEKLCRFEDAIANFDPSVILGALGSQGGMGAILGSLVK